jgi:AcrR family transcriptional regulator
MKDQQARILEAAQEIFGRFGLKKTSMADIAQAAGMGKASIYHYFASKEHLFAAVIESEIKKFWLKIDRRLLKMNSNPGEKLRVFISAKMQYVNEFENVNNAFRDQNLEHMALIQELKLKTELREIEYIRGFLKEGVTLGKFEVEDLDHAAAAIVTAFRGLEYPWAVRVPEEKYQVELDAMLNLLLNGLRKQNG